MSAIFEWLSNMENTKPLALVIFFVTFILIVGYVYSGKKRRQRFESYRYIPFQDDDAAMKENEKGKENG